MYGLFGESFTFELIYSGAWLHWAERLAEQALESIRRVANELRLVVLRGCLLLLSVLQSAALRLQLEIASVDVRRYSSSNEGTGLQKLARSLSQEARLGALALQSTPRRFAQPFTVLRRGPYLLRPERTFAATRPAPDREDPDAAGTVDSWSYDEQLQPESYSPEISCVAGDDKLSSSLCTNDDVGIDDVGRPGSRQ